MADFLQTVRERVVIYDGAMGTSVQVREPTADDFWGKEGCNELLVLSRPDLIRDIHASFLAVGCDVIETDTFGATRIVLQEYSLETQTSEMNQAAAKLARAVADEFSTPAKPRFVAGSMGPTTKLPSLGHIGFDEMVAAYLEQASALIAGGVDIVLTHDATGRNGVDNPTDHSSRRRPPREWCPYPHLGYRACIHSADRSGREALPYLDVHRATRSPHDWP